MCHPITSFFETIDEPGVIVLVRITEVRTMEKRSLTPAPSCPPPLLTFGCPQDILMEPFPACWGFSQAYEGRTYCRIRKTNPLKEVVL